MITVYTADAKIVPVFNTDKKLRIWGFFGLFFIIDVVSAYQNPKARQF